MLKGNFERSPHLLENAHSTCYAQPDRCEAGVLRCYPCGLTWEISDPIPPKCPLATNGVHVR